MGLAESRRRVKIGADPRNQLWGNDKQKFGYRLMQKMGWSEGKGLGSNEDGMAEHLKIRLKMNNLGVGATVKNSDNWLSNSSDFEKLLVKLNSQKDKEDKESSQNEPEPNSSETFNSTSQLKNQSSNTTEATDSVSVTPISNITPNSSSSNLRLAHRAKFRKMIQMASRESQGLQEILGVRKSGPTDPSSQESAVDSSSRTKKDKIKNDAKMQTSSLTIEEYFAQKNVSNPFNFNLDFNLDHSNEYSTSSFVGFQQGSSPETQDSASSTPRLPAIEDSTSDTHTDSLKRKMSSSKTSSGKKLHKESKTEDSPNTLSSPDPGKLSDDNNEKKLKKLKSEKSKSESKSKPKSKLKSEKKLEKERAKADKSGKKDKKSKKSDKDKKSKKNKSD